MQYHGPLFGKFGRKYIPLKLTSDDVDRMEKQNEELRAANIKCSRLASEKAAEAKRLVAELDDARRLAKSYGLRVQAAAHDFCLDGTCDWITDEIAAHPEIFTEEATVTQKPPHPPKAEGPCHLCGAPNYACEHIPGVPF